MTGKRQVRNSIRRRIRYSLKAALRNGTYFDKLPGNAARFRYGSGISREMVRERTR